MQELPTTHQPDLVDQNLCDHGEQAQTQLRQKELLADYVDFQSKAVEFVKNVDAISESQLELVSMLLTSWANSDKLAAQKILAATSLQQEDQQLKSRMESSFSETSNNFQFQQHNCSSNQQHIAIQPREAIAFASQGKFQAIEWSNQNQAILNKLTGLTLSQESEQNHPTLAGLQIIQSVNDAQAIENNQGLVTSGKFMVKMEKMEEEQLAEKIIQTQEKTYCYENHAIAQIQLRSLIPEANNTIILPQHNQDLFNKDQLAAILKVELSNSDATMQNGVQNIQPNQVGYNEEIKEDCKDNTQSTEPNGDNSEPAGACTNFGQNQQNNLSLQVNLTQEQKSSILDDRKDLHNSQIRNNFYSQLEAETSIGHQHPFQHQIQLGQQPQYNALAGQPSHNPHAIQTNLQYEFQLNQTIADLPTQCDQNQIAIVQHQDGLNVEPTDLALPSTGQDQLNHSSTFSKGSGKGSERTYLDQSLHQVLTEDQKLNQCQSQPINWLQIRHLPLEQNLNDVQAFLLSQQKQLLHQECQKVVYYIQKQLEESALKGSQLSIQKQSFWEAYHEQPDVKNLPNMQQNPSYPEAIEKDEQTEKYLLDICKESIITTQNGIEQKSEPFVFSHQESFSNAARHQVQGQQNNKIQKAQTIKINESQNKMQNTQELQPLNNSKILRLNDQSPNLKLQKDSCNPAIQPRLHQKESIISMNPPCFIGLKPWISIDINQANEISLNIFSQMQRSHSNKNEINLDSQNQSKIQTISKKHILNEIGCSEKPPTQEKGIQAAIESFQSYQVQLKQPQVSISTGIHVQNIEQTMFQENESQNLQQISQMADCYLSFKVLDQASHKEFQSILTPHVAFKMMPQPRSELGKQLFKNGLVLVAIVKLITRSSKSPFLQNYVFQYIQTVFSIESNNYIFCQEANFARQNYQQYLLHRYQQNCSQEKVKEQSCLKRAKFERQSSETDQGSTQRKKLRLQPNNFSINQQCFSKNGNFRTKKVYRQSNEVSLRIWNPPTQLLQDNKTKFIQALKQEIEPLLINLIAEAQHQNASKPVTKQKADNSPKLSYVSQLIEIPIREDQPQENLQKIKIEKPKSSKSSKSQNTRNPKKQSNRVKHPDPKPIAYQKSQCINQVQAEKVETNLENKTPNFSELFQKYKRIRETKKNESLKVISQSAIVHTSKSVIESKPIFRQKEKDPEGQKKKKPVQFIEELFGMTKERVELTAEEQSKLKKRKKSKKRGDFVDQQDQAIREKKVVSKK